MKYTTIFAGLGVCSLLGLAAACGDDETTPGTTTTTTTTTTTGTTTTGAGGEGTGGEGTGGATGGSGGTSELPNDVDTYCATIMKSCSGENQQYTDEATCKAVAAHFTAGDKGTGAGATGENTLGCRIYHATAAEGGPDVHCTHAGPGGDGQCGGNCESFCALNVAICAGGDAAFKDEAECLTECAKYDTTDKYNTAATSSTNEGFACHLYHLTAAASAAGVHCPHTAPMSGPCGS